MRIPQTIPYFLQRNIRKDVQKVILDFSNITFISRSATDEFLTFFEQNNIEYLFTNQSENIVSMFSAVKNSHNRKQKRSFRDVPVVSFRSYKELNEFLSVL
ncbi:MAG: hypothetical protein AB2L24_05920 [Mangrovibacterium sp.]